MNIGAEFTATNNNGACCISDNLYSSNCGYALSVGDPNSIASACLTVCQNDNGCKGYSTHTRTLTTGMIVLQQEFCVIYTDSSSCTPPSSASGVQSSNGPLSQNAICPADNAGCHCLVEATCSSCNVDYSSGCYIKSLGKLLRNYTFVQCLILPPIDSFQLI